MGKRDRKPRAPQLAVPKVPLFQYRCADLMGYALRAVPPGEGCMFGARIRFVSMKDEHGHGSVCVVFPRKGPDRAWGVQAYWDGRLLPPAPVLEGRVASLKREAGLVE